MGRVIGIVVLVVVVLFAIAWALGLVNVRQTEVAKMPDVEVRDGQMPAFDADVADVDVGTRNETVEVPDVDVQRPADR